MATNAQRAHVVHVLDNLKAHAAQLDYPPGDQRDNRDAAFWHMTEQTAAHVISDGGRLSFDCSELGAWVLKCAGLWHWTQPGYTGSHLQLLTQHYTDAKEARPGALVIFGPGTGDHECVVHTADPAKGNPLLAGHGRPGFDVERLAVVAPRHRPPVTFLSIAHL